MCMREKYGSVSYANEKTIYSFFVLLLFVIRLKWNTQTAVHPVLFSLAISTLLPFDAF